MYMLMQGENTLGVWRLDGPGNAVLTQLWEMAVPVRILGLTFGKLQVTSSNHLITDCVGSRPDSYFRHVNICSPVISVLRVYILIFKFRFCVRIPIFDQLNSNCACMGFFRT